MQIPEALARVRLLSRHIEHPHRTGQHPRRPTSTFPVALRLRRQTRKPYQRRNSTMIKVVFRARWELAELALAEEGASRPRSTLKEETSSPGSPSPCSATQTRTLRVKQPRDRAHKEGRPQHRTETLTVRRQHRAVTTHNPPGHNKPPFLRTLHNHHRRRPRQSPLPGPFHGDIPRFPQWLRRCNTRADAIQSRPWHPMRHIARPRAQS